ncbi:unnamed protein product [Meganyctiphanes norvegica]|uniref:CN hydrolase domain-containing protein n=1 Tax=Meganyctiphanes norvegica TaxID=48144 RepID=A0AAV2QN35_MEGNR
MDRMLENVKLMTNFTMEARQKQVDILVFPENGIVSLHPDGRNDTERYGQYVPDPKDKVVPCLLPVNNRTEVTNALSCMARKGGMYVVVNMAERADCKKGQDKGCDDDGNLFFNCNVVFDRNGTVIAKWRKLHLWHENPRYNYGNLTNEDAMFTTDFGVTFTQHICFDILFGRPSLANIEKYGVKDVIMSTAWVDSLPFGISPQWQYGWSRDAGANLVVAGLHLFYKGSLGSGIYPAASNPKNFTYTWDDTQEGGKLLVADVNTTKSKLFEGKMVTPRYPSTPLEQNLPEKNHDTESAHTTHTSGIPVPHHNITRWDLSTFEIIDLPPKSFQIVELCDYAEDETQVCCQVVWDNPNGTTHYLLMASSGVMNITNYFFFNQVCAVVHCPTGDIDSCAEVGPPTHESLPHFTLTGFFKTPYVQPSVVTQDLKLVSEEHWKYETIKGKYNESTTASIASETMDNLMAATLWGRWYDKDPYCQHYPC